MRRRFVADRVSGNRAELIGSHARHLLRVLRARVGQQMELTDGHRAWLAQVSRIGRDYVEFELLEPIASAEPVVAIRLLLGIVRFERFEWCLEKLTELGVREIQPLQTMRSEAALVAAAGKRLARWRRIVLAAAQQARRTSIPQVLEPVPPGEAFVQAAAADARILLSESADAPPFRRFSRRQPRSVVLAIGPEGGWSEQELELGRRTGFEPASLGPLILRTETAAIVAVAWARFHWEP